jgi:hypothetical protein
MSIFFPSRDIFEDSEWEMGAHYIIDPFAGLKRVHLPIGRAWG